MLVSPYFCESINRIISTKSKMNRLITTLIASALLFALSGAGAVAKDESKGLHEQLVGYWAPNREAMIKMMLAQAKEAGQEKGAAEMVQGLIDRVIGSMAMEFTKDKSIMHTPDGAKTTEYKVVSTDDATGEIKVKVTDEKGKTEDGSAVLKGNILRLRKGKHNAGPMGEIVLERISEESFKQRLASIKKLEQSRPKPPKPGDLKKPAAPKNYKQVKPAL